MSVQPSALTERKGIVGIYFSFLSITGEQIGHHGKSRFVVRQHRMDTLAGSVVDSENVRIVLYFVVIAIARHFHVHHTLYTYNYNYYHDNSVGDQ